MTDARCHQKSPKIIGIGRSRSCCCDSFTVTSNGGNQQPKPILLDGCLRAVVFPAGGFSLRLCFTSGFVAASSYMCDSRNKSPPLFEIEDNKASERWVANGDLQRCTAYDDADIFWNDLLMMQRAGADDGDCGDGAEWY